jgi:CheY-like chemotaxis protein
MNSDRSAQLPWTQPIPLEAGDRDDSRDAFTASGENPRNRRILVITDSDSSAKLLTDAFEANTYDVLATSNMYEAVRFVTTRDPGSILLMLPSLAATCEAARQLRPHTSIKIVAFSEMPVTETEKNVARKSGCDDYRDAFLRDDELG